MQRRRDFLAGLVVLVLGGCPEVPPRVPPTGSPPDPDTAERSDSGPTALPAEIAVTVTLDGVPVEGALVMQGGGRDTWLTGPDGRATVVLDPGVPGERVVVAAHPEARVVAAEPGAGAALNLALSRFDATDNPAYVFPFRTPACGTARSGLARGRPR